MQQNVESGQGGQYNRTGDEAWKSQGHEVEEEGYKGKDWEEKISNVEVAKRAFKYVI